MRIRICTLPLNHGSILTQPHIRLKRLFISSMLNSRLFLFCNNYKMKNNCQNIMHTRSIIMRYYIVSMLSVCSLHLISNYLTIIVCFNFLPARELYIYIYIYIKINNMVFFVYLLKINLNRF